MLRIRSALGFFLFTAGVGLGACGSDSDKEKLKAAKLAEGCTLNSNCENPLVCTFERCHRECEEDRDCAGEERCVQGATGRVCQLSIHTGCTSNAQCKGTQTCGVDKECRDKCDDTSDCGPGQVCAVSKECASTDPTKDIVDPQGNIQPDPFGGTGGAGGAGGTSGSGGVGGTAGNGGVGGTGGGTGGTAGSGGTAGAGGTAGTSGSGGTGGTGGAIQCPAGLGNCDSNPGDCETSLALITSCGGCDITCDASHATVRCSTTTYTCEIDTAGGGCNAGWANCDNNATTGCEAELAKDKNNCGTCGKSCGGGECASSQCRAAVVMDPAGTQYQNYMRGFLAGNTVYATYNYSGIVARSVTLPPTTPASEGTVIHSAAAPPAIGPTLADPGTGFLYFAASSSIVKKRLDGTLGIGEVLTTVAQPANLTMNATALFFSTYSAGSYNIYTGAKSASSAAAAPIISGRGNIYELFAAGTRLYWTEYVSTAPHYRLFTALQSGGTVTELDENIGNGNYIDFATDGTYVYWNQYSDIAKIKRVAIATSTKASSLDVEVAQSYPTEGLAVDDTYVYFANNAQLIRRTLKDGTGTAQNITQLNGGAPYWYGLFGVDSQYLYGIGSQGEILRVAKTP